MAVIKAQKIPRKKLKDTGVEDLLATFCYFFPQYKYHEAQKLAYVRVTRMMKVARRENALKMLQLINIVAAPHTKKGAGVKKLVDHYNKLIG